MKLYVTILTVFLSTIAFGQSLKTVKTKSRYLVEHYEVRVDNDTLRDGDYRKYFREGNVLLEEGEYANNRRTGVWTFYDAKRQPELVYNYSTRQVLTNNRTAIDSMGVIQQAGREEAVRLTPPPTYLASTYQIMGILLRESRLPVHLQRAGIAQLSYQIAATVSPAGAHYRVIPSHPDKAFRQNAQQATLLAFQDVQWLPASYEGQPVTAIYLLPAVMLQGFSVVRTMTIRP